MKVIVFSDFLATLEIVNLTSNICIDENFSGSARIQELTGVESKCKYERPRSNDNEFFCDQIIRSSYGIYCEFGSEANISSEDYTIISNDYPRIQHFSISDYKRNEPMKNIHFLPIVNKFIRNVILYEAEKTSVKTIAKKNFDGMVWLRILVLTSNQIETVQNDAFQGLDSILKIDLGE